jgi:intergrase/recombinase
MHFKYPQQFVRRTKNVFISFIPESLINEISNCKPLTYQMIVKRLRRKNIKCRINELRDYFGTFLLQHGILEAEINLLQGRIPSSIFIKHYWSPKLSELRDRVFKALNELEQTL